MMLIHNETAKNMKTILPSGNKSVLKHGEIYFLILKSIILDFGLQMNKQDMSPKQNPPFEPKEKYTV